MDKCKTDAFNFCAKESRSRIGNDPNDIDAEYDPVYREECITRLNQKCVERNTGGKKSKRSKKSKSKKSKKNRKSKKTKKNRK